MALERQWNAVYPPVPFTADGTAFGVVTVGSTEGFKVKMTAYLQAVGQPILSVQVKRILSPTQLIVGTINNAQLGQWAPLNINAYTVFNDAAIGAEQQPKSILKPDDIEVVTYEQEPTVARRVVFVDQFGNFYDDDNPLPATFSGTISVGEVIVKGTNDNTIEPNADGSINVVVESVPSPNTTVVSVYSEALAVAANSTVQIVSYTIPAGKTAVFQRAPVSGENIGRYHLLINGVTRDTLRTMFGDDLSQMFDFTSGNDSGFPLSAGDVVSIEVTNPRPYVGDYNARLQILLIS